jgi:hypothetical protein
VQGPVRPEKAAIAARCDAFIATVLVPRFLPEIRRHPEFNTPIDLHGAWRGSAYRFLQTWQTSGRHGPVERFEVPFARLTYLGRDRFDLDWHRHTGQWWPLRRGLALEEALAEIEGNPILHPVSGG